MMNNSTYSLTRKISGTVLAVTALASVIAEFFLSGIAPVRFMSYFTIWSNLAIGVYMAFVTPRPDHKAFRIRPGASLQTALAVYILVVTLVYNIMLRGTWAFGGRMAVVNNLLHVVIPALYLVYWFLFTQKGSLQWRHLLHWMGFPLAYLAWTFIHGENADWYPYPFLNVLKLGYPAVIFNSLMLTLLFMAAGSLLILLNRWPAGRSISNP